MTFSKRWVELQLWGNPVRMGVKQLTHIMIIAGVFKDSLAAHLSQRFVPCLRLELRAPNLHRLTARSQIRQVQASVGFLLGRKDAMGLKSYQGAKRRSNFSFPYPPIVIWQFVQRPEGKRNQISLDYHQKGRGNARSCSLTTNKANLFPIGSMVGIHSDEKFSNKQEKIKLITVAISHKSVYVMKIKLQGKGLRQNFNPFKFRIMSHDRT